MTHTASFTCDDFLDLAAAVALDAAEESDSRLVEQHALACPACAQRLLEFRETADLLGSVVPQLDPPAALRGRVLEVAGLEARQPVRPRRLWTGGRAAWLVAAASLMVSIGAITWVAMLQNQMTVMQQDAVAARDRAARYDHVVEVLASDTLAIRPLQPMVQTISSRGMVYMDPSSGTGMLMCHDLPAIEQGHAYQIWFVRGTERMSAGMLWPDHAGNGYALIRVPADLQSFDSIGLTDEPGSGSQWPTTPRVMGTALKATDQ